VTPLLGGQEDLKLSGEVSKETIDYLTRQILKVEGVIQDKVKLRKPFLGLQTVPGIGKILGLTIMLETGTIERFPTVGDFFSYCRKVPTKWTSNDKKKVKATPRMATDILFGLFLRRRNLLGAMISWPGVFTTGRHPRPISWLLMRLWRIS
jgi:transposase